MDEIYCGHSVRFAYPGFWEVTEQQDGDDVSITVHSPETSFWSLSLLFDKPDPDEVIQSALETFRSEYEELDVHPVEAHLCQRSSSACDLHFVCLELINSAFLRTFRTDSFTAFVLYQANDRELEVTQELLDAICESLECDDDDEME